MIINHYCYRPIISTKYFYLFWIYNQCIIILFFIVFYTAYLFNMFPCYNFVYKKSSCYYY